jgi:hypothetical protein
MLRRLFAALTLSVALLLPISYARSDGHALRDAGVVSVFDTSKHLDARRAVLRTVADFPVLGGNFEVLDPYTGTGYNCISHSLGIYDRWVNPLTGPATQPLVHMDRMYREKGYRRVNGLDFATHSGVRKIVVYAKVEGGKIKDVTHAAVQEADGKWSSKLGQLPLIRHLDPQALNGPCYGVPVAVYEKRVS